MKFLTLIFSTYLTICFAQASHPNYKWNLESDKNGIKVYKAKGANHKSGIIPIKLQTTLDFPPERVLSVLNDSDRKSEWVPKVEDAKTVEQISSFEKVEYTRYHSPWPFDDRTFVINIKGGYYPDSKSVRVTLHSTEHKKIPHNKDYVRGTAHLGTVIVKRAEGDPQKTFLEMSFLTEFKGYIPVWIINMVQRKWPRKLIKQLNNQLRKKDIIVHKDLFPDGKQI